ncbi:MAG: amidohydrolase family protein [Bryobacteraceae bacterium]
MNTPWGDLAVADAHVHFFSRRFFESLAGPAATPSGTPAGAPSGKSVEDLAATLAWQLPPEDPAGLGRAWAAELDLQGVGQAALIASFPGDEASVAAAVRAVPGRFWPYAMVNPLAAASAGPPAGQGMRALCLFPAMHCYSLHDPRVEPVLERAAALRQTVFVHCGVLTVGVRRKLGLRSPFDMRFSNPLDLHAIALRYPKTPFVVPHFGAGYFREALMLADLCPNVYLDTSSSNSWTRYEGLDLKTVFRRALAVAGPGRLLFGTDSSFFPRGWHRAVFEEQVRVLAELEVSAADAGRILGGNLRRISSET